MQRLLPNLPDKAKKWSTLIGCSLLLLAIGFTHATGNFNTYLTSYLRVHVDPTINFARTAILSTVTGAVSGLSSIICSILIDKFRISLLLTAIIGCIVYDTGILLSYFAVKSSFWFYLATHSVLLGIGMGIVSYPPFAISLPYFPKKLGVGSSLITLSLSIGTIVSTQLQTAYINPENLSPGEIVSKNERYFSKEQVEKLSTLPNIFLILGFTAAALQAISILMIFEKKSDRKSMSFFNRKKKKTKEEQERADKADDKQKAEIAEIMNDRHPNSIGIDYRNPNEGYNLKQAFKNFNYWKIMLVHFFVILQFGFLQHFYRQFGETFIKNDRFIGIVSSLITASSAVGHIVWGFFVDKFSFKTTIILLSSISIEFLCTFYFISFTDSAKSALYLIWLVCIFFASSGIHVALPPVLIRSFGIKNYASLHSTIAIARFLDSLIILGFAQIYTKIGFEWIFLIEALMGLIGLGITWSFNIKNYLNEDM